MAKITIEFDTGDEKANDILAAFVGGTGGATVTSMQVETADNSSVENTKSMHDQTHDEEADAAAEKKAETAAKRKAAREKKAEAEAAAKAEAEAKEAADAGLGDDDDEAETAGPTREDVRAALKKYAKLEGQPAAVSILKDAGASTMSELEEDKFQEVIDAASVE